MIKATLVLCLLALVGCDSARQNQRITSLESNVKQLQTQVAELKQKKAEPEHHYELRSEGFRTFRFDPATGDTCIKLTTDDDWKRKATKSESCDCVDNGQEWLAMPRGTDDERLAAKNFYDLAVKSACGN